MKYLILFLFILFMIGAIIEDMQKKRKKIIRMEERLLNFKLTGNYSYIKSPTLGKQIEVETLDKSWRIASREEADLVRQFKRKSMR